MNVELIQEVKRIRNAVAHRGHRFDLSLLAERLKQEGLSVSPADLQSVVAALLQGSGEGEYYVPGVAANAVRLLLEEQSARLVFDPWPGLGVLASTAQATLGGQPRTVVCARNEAGRDLGLVLAPELEWHVGDPLALLEEVGDPIDVVISVLPFGRPASRPVEFQTDLRDAKVRVRDFGQALLVASSLRMSTAGMGLFVVTPNFFLRSDSVFGSLSDLGLGLEAALELPAGSFAPFTGLATYLLVVRKRVTEQMFVAQLTQDEKTNREIMHNLRSGVSGGALELAGC